LIDLLYKLKLKILRIESVAFAYITFDLSCFGSLEEFWFIDSGDHLNIFKDMMKLKHPFRKLVIDNQFYVDITFPEYASKHTKQKLIREQLENNYSIREIELIDIDKTFSSINDFNCWKRSANRYLST